MESAISFGLAHIPVELFSAQKRSELDLTMLDRKDFSPIGCKRVNKKTGNEVAWENIVKGYQYEDDQYVVLSEEDLKRRLRSCRTCVRARPGRNSRQACRCLFQKRLENLSADPWVEYFQLKQRLSAAMLRKYPAVAS